MRVISRRAKNVKAGGLILAAANVKGIGRNATTHAGEWALVVTNDKGKEIAFQYWWQMSEPMIVGNRIEWSASGQRVSVIGPVVPAVAEVIMDRATDPECRARYDAALAAAMAEDQQETNDLHAAKAAKAAQRQGGGELALTETQSAALKSDRERTWKIAIVGAIAAIAVIGGTIALVLEDDSDTARNTRSEPTGCTWDWVPGKAPVDVGWIDAVQYCYPD
jgi:hypothetical protein